MSTSYRYPDYQPHPLLSATVYQCGEEIDWGQKFATVTRTYVGPDNDILDMGNDYKVGTSVTIGTRLSGSIQSCKTTKIEADRSKLVYVARAKNITGSGGGGDDPDPNILDTVWQVTMAQMEVPLYRYCSPTASPTDSTYGNAVVLNQWENAAFVDKNAYKYRTADPNTEEWEEETPTALAGRTLDIAKLLNAGTESRLVFYPQATRVTTCYDYTALSNYNERISALNYIDNTPSEIDLGQNYSWLKSAFDLQQNTDGSWNVTESWIGTPEYLGKWNPGLYDKNDHWNMWKES